MTGNCQFQAREQVLIFNTDAVRAEIVTSGPENETKYTIKSAQCILVIELLLLLTDKAVCRTPRGQQGHVARLAPEFKTALCRPCHGRAGRAASRGTVWNLVSWFHLNRA